MTISILSETLIPIREAVQHLPKRNGKRIHYQTVHRWAKKGARGNKLETTFIGGHRYTSLEAIDRFSLSHFGEGSDSARAAIDLLAAQGV